MREVGMNVETVLASEEKEGALASFGSGDRSPGGRVGGRAARQGGGLAPAGATQALMNRAARLADQGGRGNAARRALARELAAAATRRRSVGGNRLGGSAGGGLTNAEVAAFRDRLNRLSGAGR